MIILFLLMFIPYSYANSTTVNVNDKLYLNNESYKNCVDQCTVDVCFGFTCDKEPPHYVNVECMKNCQYLQLKIKEQ